MDRAGDPPRVTPAVFAASCRCPRCAYDLRGEVAQWSNECPLHGVCAECGIQFEWRDVLAPWRLAPRWSIEAGSRWAIPLRFLATAAMSAAPQRFWRSVRMEQRVRPRRLVAFLGCIALTPIALWLALHAAFVIRCWLELSGTIRSGGPITSATTHDPVRAVLEGILMPSASSTTGTFTLTAPPNVLVAPPIGAGWAFAWTVQQNPGSVTRTPTAITLTLPYPAPRTLFANVVDPRQPIAGFNLPDLAATWVAPSPFAATFSPQGLPFHTVVESQAARIWGRAPRAIPALLLALVGAATSFIVLRTSAREAKVSRTHLARIVCFGAIATLPALAIPPLAAYLPAIVGPLHRFVPEQPAIDLACLALPAVFLFGWWMAASHWYLRMRHGLGVGLAAASIGMLLSLLFYVTLVAELWMVWTG